MLLSLFDITKVDLNTNFTLTQEIPIALEKNSYSALSSLLKVQIRHILTILKIPETCIWISTTKGKTGYHITQNFFPFAETEENHPFPDTTVKVAKVYDKVFQVKERSFPKEEEAINAAKQRARNSRAHYIPEENPIHCALPQKEGYKIYFLSQGGQKVSFLSQDSFDNSLTVSQNIDLLFHRINKNSADPLLLLSPGLFHKQLLGTPPEAISWLSIAEEEGRYRVITKSFPSFSSEENSQVDYTQIQVHPSSDLYSTKKEATLRALKLVEEKGFRYIPTGQLFHALIPKGDSVSSFYIQDWTVEEASKTYPSVDDRISELFTLQLNSNPTLISPLLRSF